MPDRTIRSPYRSNLFRNHAEEGVLNEFDQAVTRAGISPENVESTLRIHQSNPTGVCNKCTEEEVL